jgi:hypothetical protein
MTNWTAARNLSLGLVCIVFSANASSLVATSGQVTFLSSPPASVASGGLQSNTTAYVFEESELTLTSPVDVDITTPGTYTTVASLTPGTIGAGTDVEVYMLESQPSSVPASPNDYQTYEGSLTFDTPVLGIIVETASLNNTDATLGAPGTVYPPPSDIYSGLDLNTPGCSGSTCGNDGVVLSINGNTVDFGFVTNYSEDEIRIITAATPEPSGIAFTFLALLPLLALKSVRSRINQRG